MKQINNHEAEQYVLGALLIAGVEAFDRMADVGLATDDFYCTQHKFIFAAIVKMLAESTPIDVMTVNKELMSKEGAVNDQLNYLVDLDRNTPSAANAKHYAEIVRECSIARQAVASARELIDNLYQSGGTNAVNLIAATAKEMDDSLCTQNDDSSSYSIVQLMKIGLQDFSDRYDNQGQISGTLTGFDAVDNALNGMEGGDLIVIAGRPGMGKTTFATSVARNVANNGLKGEVLIHHLEMGAKQIAMRELAARAGVNMSHLKRGDDDGGQNFQKMETMMSHIEDNMTVDTRVDINLSQIKSKARKIKRKHGLKLIVIDYLQLMSDTSKRHGNKNDEISYISRQCKALAKELDVPVLLLSQLSRKSEERADKRPALSDLRDSGAIEQDADVVLFVHREDYYNKDSMNPGISTIIVAKSRMGESGIDAHIKFEGRYSRFVNLPEDFTYHYPTTGKSGSKGRGFSL